MPPAQTIVPPPMPPPIPRSDGLAVVRAPNGAPVTVSAEDASRFQGLLNDLHTAGIRVDPSQTGGYSPRNIRGTNTPSQHASGRAIDINWTDNPVGGRPGGMDDPTAQFNVIPTDLARNLARRHGLEWGGDWRNPDPMHFQVARGAAPAPPLQQRSITNYAGAAPSPVAPPVQVASSAPTIVPAPRPPQQRSTPATNVTDLARFPRAMPGRIPTEQLWRNQSPTQKWDTLNRTFDMPPQPPDGMDHYTQTGLLPPGTQARPDPTVSPAGSPPQAPGGNPIPSGPRKAPPGPGLSTP